MRLAMAPTFAATIYRFPDPATRHEKRHAPRRKCRIEATSQPLQGEDPITWGGTVKDLSAGGLNLAVCFPFRPGTTLAVDLGSVTGGRTVVCQVVHVHDHADGTWTLGCELLRPLSAGDVAQILGS
jgi:hypothetical protein